MGNEKRKFNTFGEVVKWSVGVYERYKEGIETNNYQQVYDAFLEDTHGIILSFNTKSVRDTMNTVPPFEWWDPRINFSRKYTADWFMDRKKLESVVKGMKDEIGWFKAKKFERAIVSHYDKKAKNLTRGNKSAIKSYRDQLKQIVRLDKLRFIG